jgi:large subunit ribosomal protein L18
MDKKLSRKRRATRTRKKIRELGIARLSVNRTLQHVYAQVIVQTPKGDHVLASASTLDKEIKALGYKGGNIKSAQIVGQYIAKRAVENGINNVAFDRSGFMYHGCIKALAEAAREAGLVF